MKFAVLGFWRRFFRSSSVGSRGLSRVSLTRQRNPKGASFAARNWCHVAVGT